VGLANLRCRKLLSLGTALLAACGASPPVGAHGSDAGNDGAGDASPDSDLIDVVGDAADDIGSIDVVGDGANEIALIDVGNRAGDSSEDGSSDAGGVVPPSCQHGGPGMTNCGANSESCCASPEVTGGTYYRTYTNSGSGPTGEADPATISSFKLDTYDVTVGRFRQFVGAWNGGAGWLPAPGSGKHAYLNGGRGLNATGGGYEPGWLAADDNNIAATNTNLSSGCDVPSFATWTDLASRDENLPINCITWYEAYAFCIWDGGFLPSEAEWEYAAAGGSQQREYPWGSTAPGTGNQYAIYGCYYPNASGSCTGVANIAPVGTAKLGAGLWGQLDLAGNLAQWGVDWWAPYADCADCADVATGVERVLRGDDFSFNASALYPPHRNSITPTLRSHFFGFRCARAP